MSTGASTRRIFISAGDVSGDQLGAALVRSLSARRSDLAFSGLAGPAMIEAGVEPVASSDALAIGGLVEVLRAFGTVRETRRALLDHVRDAPPDLVVLIDSGGFHLPLARALRQRCAAQILYYVAPQVWAWRRGRIRKIAARIDRLAVILPFEAEHYAGSGLKVDFVGHPLVDEIAGPGTTSEVASDESASGGEGSEVASDESVSGGERSEVGSDAARESLRGPIRARLGLDEAAPLLALAPGSRRNEVEAHLPVQLATLARMRETHPQVQGAVAVAPSIDRARVDALVAASGVGGGVHVIEGNARDLLRASDVALLKPGTVTTEAMLLGVPMVMLARAHPLTAALVRRLLRVPHLAMPNLVAGRRIVPEYWQQAAQPEVLARALAELLSGPARDAQLAALREAAARLGPGGASDRAAAMIEEMLEARSTTVVQAAGPSPD